MTTDSRIEIDSLGEVNVPVDALWGAQTQRSIQHFQISDERMPMSLIMALAMIKREGALVNGELGQLDVAVSTSIASAAEEVLAGMHGSAFPLSVWQTGSGTQTNMNMNEVLANRASELMGGVRGSARIVHPNDHVNLGQSSNDIFPTAMHLSGVTALVQDLLPALKELTVTFSHKSDKFADIVKIGRTHLQDAIPLTLGQEISGWVAQLEHAHHAIDHALISLYPLAVGATAVGTGLNTHEKFGDMVSNRLAKSMDLPFRCAANRFSAIASHDELVNAHGALKLLAVALMKIANDVRWLGSGPRCGLGELLLPENEPGSSIMPGKVNPTQCEALTMVCSQVMGNDVAMSIAGASGNFELNVFKPLIIYNFLQSARLLADSMVSFNTYCADGLEADRERIATLLGGSLMLATALTPHIGYDQAARIAKYAHTNQCSLREAATTFGEISGLQFDDWVNPEQMV